MLEIGATEPPEALEPPGRKKAMDPQATGATTADPRDSNGHRPPVATNFIAQFNRASSTEDALERLNTVVPALGIRLLLPSFSRNAWRQKLDVATIARAVSTPAPDTVHIAEGRILARSDYATIRLDAPNGYVRYIRRKRAPEAGYRWKTGARTPHALQVALAIIDALDIPVDSQSLPTRVQEFPVSPPTQKRGLEVSTARSIRVIIQRTVEGIPVVGSELRVSVAPGGSVGRLKVRWPKFRISSRAVIMRPRVSVIQEAVTRMLELPRSPSAASPPLTVRGRLVYLPQDDGYIPTLEIIPQAKGSSFEPFYVAAILKATDLCRFRDNPA